MTSTDLAIATENGRGDIALAGEVTDGMAGALERLVAGLHQQAKAFDDISVTLHNETKPDGSNRSCFSFRCYKHR